MAIDEINNLLYALRHRRCLHVQVMRACDGNVGDGLVDFEKLKAVSRELLAERSCNLQRETALIFPDRTDQPGKLRASQRARGRADHRMSLDLFNDVFLVRL